MIKVARSSPDSRRQKEAPVCSPLINKVFNSMQTSIG